MGTLEAELSDGNNLVLLKGASSIGITASAERKGVRDCQPSDSS